MNYVYIISDTYNSVTQKMLGSLFANCECRVLFNHIGNPPQLPGSYADRVSFFPVDKKSEWDNNMMGCKIQRLKKMPFQAGDNVFVLDTDLIIQDNIFKAFESEFDVCVTTRHYPYWYVVNGGVWGFRYSDLTRRFIEFYVDQIANPTWKPLVDFRHRFGGRHGTDWWVDQDFLCTIKESGMPEHLSSCKLFDLGPKYNFCPSVEENIPQTFEQAKRDIMAAVGDKEYKILHFKGRLKGVIP